MRNFLVISLITILLVVLSCVNSWAKLVPGVDVPIDPKAFWDLDAIDYADDGNVYTYRQLAGGKVYDHKRHIQNKQTTLEHITQVINITTQIANQITNLTSMSPEAILTHVLGIEEEFGNVLDTAKQAKGLMDSIQTAEKAWNSAFKQTEAFFEGKTSHIEDLADTKKMIHTLDKTYQDSFRMIKVTAKIDKEVERLKDMMRENQKAAGNKNLKQIKGQMSAAKVGQDIKKGQTLGELASAVIAEKAKENQLEVQAAQNALNSISIGSVDPYNPTKQDLENFKRPEGRGFIRF